MSPQTDPPLTDSRTAASISLTPAEILTAILPALIGMVVIAIVVMLMLL